MPVSRRDFLHLSALGIGSSLLAACGVKPPKNPQANPAHPTRAAAPAASRAPATAAPQSTTAITAPKATPAAAVPSTSDLISSEILGRPTDQSMTVNVIPAQDSQVYFEYGSAAGQYGAQSETVNASAGLPINALLGNLQPNTRYYYRTRSKPAGAADFAAGQEHTFMTRRSPGSSYSFTIDADPHNQDPNFNASLYAVTLTNAINDKPDFHINLGDTFMTEKLNINTQAGVLNSYADMRPHLGLVGADAALFLVNGNHEGELGWLLDGSDQNLAVWSTGARHEYYPNPIPNGFYTGSTTQEQFIGIRDGYFAWTWGDAHFIVLDPFWYTHSKPRPGTDTNWGWTLGKAQYDWLKTTLQTSQSKFKFIFIHNLVGGNDKDARGGIEAAPYYEWGGKNADGSSGFETHRSGWGKPIHDLLVENHVNALFHGHDHVYVKQDLDGIVYQECPQPSISRYNNTKLAQDYGYTHGDVISSSGHLRVTVTPEQATVEYVRAYLPQDENPSQKNGQVAHTYSLS